MISLGTVNVLVALGNISKLPADEKERANKLYPILNTIHFLTVSPVYIGTLAIILVVIVICASSSLQEACVTMLQDRGLFYGYGVFALIYVAGIFLTKLIFYHRRNKKVEELRTMLLSDDSYRDTLETLKEFDPAMARNIRKFIARAA